MKKLILGIASLLIAIPAVAMESTKREILKVTEKENSNFIDHLSKAVAFNQRMVEEKEITADNSIHVMLTQLTDNLGAHDNNLMNMLESNESLSKQIIDLRERIDTHPLDRIFTKRISAKSDLIKIRHIQSELTLKHLFPQYQSMTRSKSKLPFAQVCPQYFQHNKVEDKDRINFMMNNADYLKEVTFSAEDEKHLSQMIPFYADKHRDYMSQERRVYIEKYMALFIYQLTFAHQFIDIPIK